MKNLVFPRIFLHCVALGFTVSGLLLSGRPCVRIASGVPWGKANRGNAIGFSFLGGPLVFPALGGERDVFMAIV